MMTNDKLLEQLKSACLPCKNFKSVCEDHCVWSPDKGFVPNGFGGAYGDLSEVELVIVTAEPGRPTKESIYSGFSPHEMVQTSVRIFNNAMKSKKVNRENGECHGFHTNMRKILDYFWPQEELETQLRKTWCTNSVLCPLSCKSNQYPRDHDEVVVKACINEYLKPQLMLFESAYVLALGGKAHSRMEANGLKYDGYGPHPSVRKNKLKSAERMWKQEADKFHSR